MSEKLLLIMNPVAGVKKSNKYLTDILCMFSSYECSVQMTTVSFGPEKIINEYGKDKDIVVCVGGDGTFNEMVSGLIKNKLFPKVGYIPSGSTNDFASGMKISKKPLDAAHDILKGFSKKIDVGTFNNRIFAYTASFGIFTKSSYNTPRDLKNTLGYLAYVLEGIKEITEIKSYHIKIKTDSINIDSSYVFGAICNSKQIGGGMVKFPDKDVDMNDGLLEVLLIKQPKNPAELMQLAIDINNKHYTGSLFEYFSAKELTLETDDEIDWTIDGEFQRGSEKIKIKNIKSAIDLILPEEKNNRKAD
ncbi:MAG: YegS/Rv2252/BmrU family lipid kinase [Clostridia bacterium]|nr:YegS/Rv2252/BmrU family lipid kinase [Clostridia bacterium]